LNVAVAATVSWVLALAHVPAGRTEMSRVAELPRASKALALPHERLASDEGAAWFTVSDATLLEMRALDPSLHVLYFTREDYDAAVAALSPAEVRRVIARRRYRFAALDEAPGRVLDDVRRAIVWAARAGQTEPFERDMALLGRWYGKRRYEGMNAAWLLARLVEDEVRLARELGDAGRAADAAAREASARALAQELARAGAPQYEKALPYIGIERVFRIAPGDAALVEALSTAHQPHFMWRGSLVAPLGTRDLPELRADGHTVELMWPMRGDFVEVLGGRPAQIERDLSRQLERARAPEVLLAAHLGRLAVAQLSFKRWAAASLARDPAGRLLAKQVADDTPRLFAELAAIAPAAKDPAAELDGAEGAARADAALFAELARAAHAGDRAADLEQLGLELSGKQAR
jgi:hypothetical protein